jgi:hypothetical protein
VRLTGLFSYKLGLVSTVVPNPLPVAKPTLVSTQGVSLGCRCFSGSVHADHQLTRPDGCRRKQKSRLQLRPVGTLPNESATHH